MFLLKCAIHLLEFMFFAGMAGSSVVVLISFVDFTRELFGRNKPAQPQA